MLVEKLSMWIEKLSMHTELSNKFQSFRPAIEKAQELRHQPLRPN